MINVDVEKLGSDRIVRVQTGSATIAIRLSKKEYEKLKQELDKQ